MDPVFNSAATGFSVESCRQAYAAIRSGGLILVPMDVGYGLLGHSVEAIETIYRIKGRSRPCVIAGNADVLADVALLDAKLARWALEVSRWTPLAVVAGENPHSRLLRTMSESAKARITTNGTVATFLNLGPLVEQLLDRATADGYLLVGSSANKTLAGNNYRLEDVPTSIKEVVDWSIDGGPAKYTNAQGFGATIVDLMTLQVLRHGINGQPITEALDRLTGGTYL